MNLTPIRTYGRTKSRTLKPAQATLLDDLLPRLAVPTSPFDPRQLFPAVREVWIEIGFGGGEHLAAQAAAHPDVLVLGAEPFLNGVASALRHIDAGDLANVRLRLGDGRELLALLPEGSVDRLFILFPDPWPKARHHKRRLINAAFAAEASRVMAPGARLRFATDWADYAHEALAALTACPALAWTAERADDWRRGPADHFVTRYETKRLGDCAPIWLEFERRP
ncbi:MAG TPA: tRNA (guanosine(46)-N7)-methyltransferase TrmB [Caulobacteraceae bacterium]